MRQRVLISDFSLGMLSESLAGRVDVGLQQKAAIEISGFVISPDGGLRRRPATHGVVRNMGITPPGPSLLEAGTIPGFVAVRKGETDDQELQLIWIQEDPINRLVARSTDDGSEATLASESYPGVGLRATQTFYAEPTASVENQHVFISNPHTGKTWDVDLHAVSATERDDPELATVYQNRLIIIDTRWGKIATSVPLDMLNFDTTEEVAIPGTDPVEYETIETGAIVAYPDFYGAELVRWMITSAGRLLIGTDRAEYEVTSTEGVLSTDVGGFVVQQVSKIGAEDAVPAGNAVLVRRGSNVSRIKWSDQSQGYEASSLNALVGMNNVIHAQGIEAGSHMFILVLDEDQNLYCRTESMSTEVVGFSLLMEGVLWFTVVHDEVFVARESYGAVGIETIPLSSLSHPSGRPAVHQKLSRYNNIGGDRGEYYTVTADGITDGRYPGYSLPGGTVVSVWRFTGSGWEYLTDVSTSSTGELGIGVADIAAMVRPDSILLLGDGYIGGYPLGYPGMVLGDGIIGGPRMGVASDFDPIYLWVHDSEASFTSRVTTFPLQVGASLSDTKYVRSVLVWVKDSGSFRCRINDGPWELYETDVLFSGPVRFVPESSHSLVVQVTIESIGTNPLSIYSIEAEVEVGEV